MKFSVDVNGCPGTKCRRNIAENLNRLSRAHERYRRQTTDRQTTDGRATAYSERERESLKTDLTSLDRVVNRFFMKLFQTGNIDFVKSFKFILSDDQLFMNTFVCF